MTIGELIEIIDEIKTLQNQIYDQENNKSFNPTYNQNRIYELSGIKIVIDRNNEGDYVE